MKIPTTLWLLPFGLVFNAIATLIVLAPAMPWFICASYDVGDTNIMVGMSMISYLAGIYFYLATIHEKMLEIAMWLTYVDKIEWISVRVAFTKMLHLCFINNTIFFYVKTADVLGKWVLDAYMEMKNFRRYSVRK